MNKSSAVVYLVLVVVGLGAAAPLRLLRIRNMTFLFIETADGERVDVLYAPTGKTLASLPIGNVLGGEREADGSESEPGEGGPEEEGFDPELDEPRVEPSVIQAPRTQSGCGSGHRKDKHGKCRLVW